MPDRPIIFSAPMVRALLDGRKTQTRRVLKPQPELFELKCGQLCSVYLMHVEGDAYPRVTLGDGECGVITKQEVRCAVGDRLWVRETWRVRSRYDQLSPRSIPQTAHAVYSADTCEHGLDVGRMRSPIHMPRWASRLTLVVTDVRVQRLQEISEEDAIAEGLKGLTKDGKLTKYGVPDRDGFPGNDDHGWHWHEWFADVRCAYAKLWRQINGPDSWDSNPWVAAYTFTAHRCNIDAMEANHERC